jgi:hypothetical protein
MRPTKLRVMTESTKRQKSFYIKINGVNMFSTRLCFTAQRTFFHLCFQKTEAVLY